ncbi:MAG: SctK family type III secretion system sorting platform protein [Puniceicoccales bacterium]|nr:SctK family type III secretion system sorting platform protein [Puniceicoccales bacterium]
MEQWRAVWGDDDRAEEHVRLLRFLYEPAVYVHRSRLAELSIDPNALETIAATRRGWLQLNRLLLARFHLDGLSDCGPELLPRQRLIFVDCATVGRLSRLAGALYWAEDVQRTVRKGEREALLAAIGERAYAFALRKSLFFHSLLAGLPREGFEMLSLPKRVVATGRWCLMACLNGLAGDLKHRFLLKFPSRGDWAKESLADREGPLERVWELVDRLRGRLEGATP